MTNGKIFFCGKFYFRRIVSYEERMIALYDKIIARWNEAGLEGDLAMARRLGRFQEKLVDHPPSMLEVQKIFQRANNRVLTKFFTSVGTGTVC